ncbi:hypothetical protein VN97_g3373 [Penicillium thymicola]|uniref:Uncharacterized protein n=1 Tax=Penicillium thymicola TaxID=293382 RepID=A0AAI9TMA8_PENTH|nr:hypothetical protein VN97_g3373 [Penicillium thymicola]
MLPHGGARIETSRDKRYKTKKKKKRIRCESRDGEKASLEWSGPVADASGGKCTGSGKAYVVTRPARPLHS